LQRTQQRLLIGLLAAVLVLGGAAAASRLMGGPLAQSALGATHGALGSGARIAFRTVEPGGRVDTASFTAKALGVEHLTPAQLRGQLPGWTMRGSSASGVTFAPAKGGRPLYVGMAQGQVAIFFGPPRYGWIDQLTGIKAGTLAPQDASRLERGVGVASLGAAWQMLAGLSG